MDEQLKQLVDTLIKTGMAASMYEAIEKAKSIMDIKPQKTLSSQVNEETQQGQETAASTNIDSDIKNENSEIKKDIKQSVENPEKTEQLKEEIVKIKDDVDKIEEIKAEKEPLEGNLQSENDMFKEEKKVDLAKIFNNKK